MQFYVTICRFMHFSVYMSSNVYVCTAVIAKHYIIWNKFYTRPLQFSIYTFKILQRILLENQNQLSLQNKKCAGSPVIDLKCNHLLGSYLACAHSPIEEMWSSVVATLARRSVAFMQL